MLSNTSKVFIDQKNGNNLLYLPLDKLIQIERAFFIQPFRHPRRRAAPAHEAVTGHRRAHARSVSRP